MGLRESFGFSSNRRQPAQSIKSSFSSLHATSVKWFHCTTGSRQEGVRSDGETGEASPSTIFRGTITRGKTDDSASDLPAGGGDLIVNNSAAVEGMADAGNVIHGGSDAAAFDFRLQVPIILSLNGNDPAAGTSPGDALNLDLDGIVAPVIPSIP